MKAKSLTCTMAVVFFAWAITTPAFGASLVPSDQEMGKVSAGKGIPLTDAQLEAVTGGESLACGPAAEAECLSATHEAPRITIKLWDDGVKRTQMEGGGLVQSNTGGTVQFNSTMSK
jgi:hypothetical protein